MTIEHRDGDTYDPAQDGARLAGQHRRVFDLMSDGDWHTLPELRAASSARFGATDMETAISARLRDFRKERFGEYTVDTRRDGGLWYYRLVV